MTAARIELSFPNPPLNLNQRMHWAKKAQLTRAIRQEVGLKARALRQQFEGQHVHVTLHWLPRDNRRRDADNPILTAKACFDGIQDSGIVPDDDPTHMTKHMPVIHRHTKGDKPACWLTIATEGDPQ